MSSHTYPHVLSMYSYRRSQNLRKYVEVSRFFLYVITGKYYLSLPPREPRLHPTVHGGRLVVVVVINQVKLSGSRVHEYLLNGKLLVN